MSLDLQKTQATVIQIAKDAGTVALNYFGGPLEELTKKTSIDMVTQADKEAEVVIVQALLEHFPDHHIVGEEGGGMGMPADAAAYSWHVDPIDGTTNFANGIPHFCTSIALADKNMNPLVAVVYNPFTNELFTSIQGGVTTLNGKPVHVTQAPTLASSVLVTGFAYDRQTNPDNNVAEWSKMMMKSRAVRCMGSAALDFAFVAAGRFDAYWEHSLNTWDCMAGILLVLNAGGKVTNYAGDADSAHYRDGRFVASNGHIHEEILQLLNGHHAL